eukprot:3520525-Prymnesium_polylepis.2
MTTAMPTCLGRRCLASAAQRRARSCSTDDRSDSRAAAPFHSLQAARLGMVWAPDVETSVLCGTPSARLPHPPRDVERASHVAITA